MESKIEFLKPKLQSWHKTKSVSGFNMTYKNALSDVYKEWFKLNLNKSCSSCVTRALTKVANKLFSDKTSNDTQQESEQPFDAIEFMCNMTFSQLRETSKILSLPIRRSTKEQSDELLKFINTNNCPTCVENAMLQVINLKK